MVKWPPQLMGVCMGGKCGSTLCTFRDVNRQYDFSHSTAGQFGGRGIHGLAEVCLNSPSIPLFFLLGTSNTVRLALSPTANHSSMDLQPRVLPGPPRENEGVVSVTPFGFSNTPLLCLCDSLFPMCRPAQSAGLLGFFA